MSQQWKSGPPVQDVKVNTEKDLEFLWSGIARIAGEQRGNAAEFAKWDKVFKELPREVSNQAEDHFGRNKDNRDTNKKEIEAKGWTKQVEQAARKLLNMKEGSEELKNLWKKELTRQMRASGISFHDGDGGVHTHGTNSGGVRGEDY